MATIQPPALRKAAKPAAKQATPVKPAGEKAAEIKTEEEPWPDSSHLSAVEQLMEIGKRLTPAQRRKIKTWPLLPDPREAEEPAPKRKKATAKTKSLDEPLPDLSHLSPMRQLLEATKHIPAHKIKVWPLAK